MIEQVIWLTGMPRSGTTWVSQIFASHPDVRVKFCPLFSYSFKNLLDENASKEEWQGLFTKVFVTEDAFMDQEHLRGKGLVPEFSKNPEPNALLIKSNRFHHLTEGILQKCPNVSFISIVRHPCAAIHSWISNPLEFPAGQDPQKQWRTGSCRKTDVGEFWGFEDWKKVTSLHLRLAKEWRDRFLMERYDNFMKTPLEKARELFEKLGLDIPPSTREFIMASQNSHNSHRRSVYKDPSRLPDWKNSLDKNIADQIYQELQDTELAVFLEG